MATCLASLGILRFSRTVAMVFFHLLQTFPDRWSGIVSYCFTVSQTELPTFLWSKVLRQVSGRLFSIWRPYYVRRNVYLKWGKMASRFAGLTSGHAAGESKRKKCHHCWTFCLNHSTTGSQVWCWVQRFWWDRRRRRSGFLLDWSSERWSVEPGQKDEVSLALHEIVWSKLEGPSPSFANPTHSISLHQIPI